MVPGLIPAEPDSFGQLDKMERQLDLTVHLSLHVELKESSETRPWGSTALFTAAAFPVRHSKVGSLSSTLAFCPMSYGPRI